MYLCLATFQSHCTSYTMPHIPNHNIHPSNSFAQTTVQYAPEPDNSPFLSPSGKTRVQQIVGTFLFYARAIDNTMLPALNALSASQSKPTASTNKDIIQFLDYAATHPDATIRYHGSDMVLHVHSDASFLCEPNAKSRIGGFYFLSNNSLDPTKPPTQQPKLNGALHVECRLLRHIMASAAEAEIGGVFHNCQISVPIRTTLQELGHPQPPTPIQTDNSTAAGFANSTIKIKRTKAMDMNFHWVKDRVSQKEFLVFWRPGHSNLGDYATKHHSPAHHILVRPIYLHV